jgi:hypothetical protein
MLGSIQVGTHHGADGQKPVMMDTCRLIHPMLGWHAVDLGGPEDLLLMVTSFDHSEAAEDLFHGHPEVAILPHPTFHGNMPLKQHLGREGYKFAQKHLDTLTSHPGLGVQETDTVLTLAKKAEAIHPLVAFRNSL